MSKLTKKRRKEIEAALKYELPKTQLMLRDLLNEIDRAQEELSTVRNSLFDQINRYSSLLMGSSAKHLQLQREAIQRFEKALGIKLFNRAGKQ